MYRKARNLCWNICSTAERRFGAVMVERLAASNPLSALFGRDVRSIICLIRTWASGRACLCRFSEFPPPR